MTEEEWQQLRELAKAAERPAVATPTVDSVAAVGKFSYMYRVLACLELTGRQKDLAILLALKADNSTKIVYRHPEKLRVDLGAFDYAWRNALVAKGWLAATGKLRHDAKGLDEFQLSVPACGCKGCRAWLERENRETK